MLFNMYLFILTVLCTFPIIWAIQYLLDLYRLNGKLKDFKVPPGKFFLGHLLDINLNSDILGTFKGYFEKYGKLIRINATTLIPVAMIADCDIAKEILSSKSLVQKGTIYDAFKTLFGNSLPVNNETWHSERKLLSPSFSIMSVQEYLTAFNKVASTLTHKLGEIKDNISIGKHIELSVLDITYECLTGKSINSLLDENCRISALSSALVDILPEKAYRPWTFVHWIYVFTPTFWKERRLLKWALKETNNIVSHRLSKLNNTPDENSTLFIDALIFGKINGRKIAERDIRDQLSIFVIGSRDTTSLVLTCALHILGHNPHIQNRVYDELSSIFADDPFRAVTVDDLQKMEYLQAVINETMRMYPPFPFIARKFKEDQLINGTLIPSNMNIVIAIYNMHRNEEYFPNPEVFDPERFLSGKANVKPFSFIPFSAGFRNCIGQKFAMYSMKTTLAYILRKYEVTSISEKKFTFFAHVLAKVKEDLKIKVRPRN